MAGKIECLEEILIYSNEGNPWVKLFFDKVRFPDGSTGHYNRIVQGELGQAVLVIPVLNGCLGMVHQFRYAVNRWMWEFPRGLCYRGINFEDTAKNELEEEMMITSNEFEHLGTLCIDSGVLSTTIEIVLATNCQAQDFKPTEKGTIIKVRFFTKEELNLMLQEGNLVDAQSIAALKLLEAQG